MADAIKRLRDICDFVDGIDGLAEIESSELRALLDIAEAAQDMRAFIGVMFGHGPDAIIPEEVTTPLGIPVKLGAIMRDATKALSKLESPDGR